MIRFLQSGNKVTKYLLGGLLLVICGSMVTYLIPGFMSGVTVDRGGVVASVAGHEITNDQVQQAAQRILRQQRYPDAALPFVVQQVMPQLIQEAELQYEAGRMGLSVSDQEIRDELQHGAMGETFFPGGKWIGQQQYEDLLRENGLTTDAFEKGLRDQLLATNCLPPSPRALPYRPQRLKRPIENRTPRSSLITPSSAWTTCRNRSTRLRLNSRPITTPTRLAIRMAFRKNARCVIS